MAHVVMPVCLLTQDCNLVAYSGLSQAYGFNAATAVYQSATYSDSANGPCNLFVSSTGGGSIFIVDKTGAVNYQEPVRAPLYAFQTFNFTTCVTQGRLGPSYSACTASYASSGAWTANTAFFNVDVNGIQAWTVPATAEYACVPAPALLLYHACLAIRLAGMHVTGHILPAASRSRERAGAPN